MTFDITKTLSLIKGGLLDHDKTWGDYLAETPDWQSTAIALTAPLMLANVVLSVVFSRLIGGYSYLAYYDSFFSALLWGLVMAPLGFIIAVLIFNFLAGTFRGQSDFNRSFAAVSLAAIPAWVAGIVGALVPSLGALVAFAGGIMSLVFMYKIMPLALAVPDEKRTVHFVVSLIAIVIVNAVIASVLGIGSVDYSADGGTFSQTDRKSSPVRGPGVLSEIERQSQLMDAARSDIYDPPADGELTERQVRDYIKVLQKAQNMSEEYAAEMQQLADDMKAKEKAGENISPSDLAKMYGGISTAVSASNAEMEIVKTGDGNWAEHQWIKEQLRIARIQQGDGSDAMAHNYELYLEYEDDLKAVN